LMPVSGVTVMTGRDIISVTFTSPTLALAINRR